MPKPEEIRAARRKLHLTQTQAGELLGVTRTTWNRYERGVRPMPPDDWALWLHKAGLVPMPFVQVHHVKGV